MSLKSDLERFKAKTEAKMNKAVRMISLQSFSECIMMSPVDTGRFRGNWQTKVGAAPAGIVEVLDPSGQIATAKVQGAVAGMEVGDVIYMSNNLPYAGRLEDGSSTQAPGGMVKLTVQRWQPIANKIIAEVGAE